MNSIIETPNKFRTAHREETLRDLIDLVKIPSISTSDEHVSDIHKAAEWIADYLRKMGATDVQIMPTDGHPVVFGEMKAAKSGSDQTVLVYGHYDVQPSEPLELWKSEPF